MGSYIVFGVFIVVLVLYIRVIFSVHFKLQTVNFFSGGLGAGKTLEIVTTGYKIWRRSWHAHYLTFGILKPREVYSNVPICLRGSSRRFNRYVKDFTKAFYSNGKLPAVTDSKYRLTMAQRLYRDHLTGKYFVPEHSIIVGDEIGKWFPSEAKKSDLTVEEGFRLARHWYDPILLFADQSIGECNISLRRRVNVLYVLSSFTRLFFIPFLWSGIYSVEVNRLNYMEDVITNTNDINTMKYPKHYAFFGKRKYVSRYLKFTYSPESVRKALFDSLFSDGERGLGKVL